MSRFLARGLARDATAECARLSCAVPRFSSVCSGHLGLQFALVFFLRLGRGVVVGSRAADAEDTERDSPGGRQHPRRRPAAGSALCSHVPSLCNAVVCDVYTLCIRTD